MSRLLWIGAIYLLVFLLSGGIAPGVNSHYQFASLICSFIIVIVMILRPDLIKGIESKWFKIKRFDPTLENRSMGGLRYKF
jgi:hypothetical protein